jgi:hypothetical protein
MDSWYVLDESSSPAKPLGPYSFDALRQMIASGQVGASTRVAKAGGANWLAAAQHPSLAGLFQSTPPRVGMAPPPTTPSIAGPSSYSFGNTFSLAFETFKAEWGKLCVAGLIFIAAIVLCGIPNWVSTFYVQGASHRGGPNSFVGPPGPALFIILFGGMCCSAALQVLVIGPLYAGLAYAGAQAVRRQMVVSDVFMGFRSYRRACVGTLFLAAVYVGIAIAAYIPMLLFGIIGGALRSEAGIVIVIVGLIVGIVVAVMLMTRVFMRLIFTPVIAIDPQMGSASLSSAIRQSWELSREKSVSMFGVLVVGSIVVALTALLLCVGYILVGLPLAAALAGSMHELVNRRGVAEARVA